jgi:hypothetical protein
MESQYIEPYTLKANILAWSELNTNEIDVLISFRVNQKDENDFKK